MGNIRKKVLLVAFGFPVQYRALRCAALAGFEVYVLGTEEASPLRYSRFCKRFAPIVRIPGADDQSLNAFRGQLEERAKSWDISIVAPADKDSVRVLGQLKGKIPLSIFPVPDAASFEILDDKWAFHGLCRELGLPVPQSWIFETKESLLGAARHGQLPQTAIVKPTCLFGEQGVMRFESALAERQLADVAYTPLMVQEFIPGDDFHCSIFAMNGEVKAAQSYVACAHEKVFGADPAIVSYAEKVARKLAVSGMMNFDTRRTAEGAIYFLECNPRPFLTQFQAAQAGVNFMETGFKSMSGSNGPVKRGTPCSVRTYRGMILAAARPWRLTPRDLKQFQSVLSDPVPVLFEIYQSASHRILPKIPFGALRNLISRATLSALLVIGSGIRGLFGSVEPQRAEALNNNS